MSKKCIILLIKRFSGTGAKLRVSIDQPMMNETQLFQQISIIKWTPFRLSFLLSLNCTLMALDATKENFLHQTTMYRSKIKPTLTLSSNIHYQNYGHQGLFPVITSRLTPCPSLIGLFFVVEAL